MADNFQKQAAAGKMTEEEAKARFFAAAGAIWYEDHHQRTSSCTTTETGNLQRLWPGCVLDLGRQGHARRHGCQRPAVRANDDRNRAQAAAWASRSATTFLRSSTDPTPLDKLAFGLRLYAVAPDDRHRAIYLR